MENKKTDNCSECLEGLHLLIDGEASPKQEAYFKAHLDECAPCFELYNVDKSVKEFVKRKIENKTVPESIINDIKDKIRQIV